MKRKIRHRKNREKHNNNPNKTLKTEEVTLLRWILV